MRKFFNSLRATANTVAQETRPLVQKSLQYAKDNPGDILLGIITVAAIDVADSIDNIEKAEELQAAVDVANYYNG